MDTIVETQQTTATGTLETLERMIARHSRERADAIARLEQEQRAAETAQLDALNHAVAASLVVVVDELRQRIRDDRAASRLVAHVTLGRPHGADELQRLADATELGEKAGLLMIPQADAFGLQERKAWLLVDASREVWG